MLGIRETGLQESWLTGAVLNIALTDPVWGARRVCNGSEADVRALRDSLESVFEKWRDDNGVFPVASVGLLGSVNPYEGKSLGECPPYACMGNRFADYADLLAKLTAEQYPTLMELEAAANGLWKSTFSLSDNIPLLPATVTKTGMQRILAVLTLSEAAAGNIESAIKAHCALGRIQKENERLLNESLRAGEIVIHALAVFAAPFKKHSAITRKPSPIRKAIARELAKSPTLKPLQLWSLLASKPPRGWTFFDNSLGKYIDIEGRKDMGWSRFSRVCKEEKDKLNT